MISYLIIISDLFQRVWLYFYPMAPELTRSPQFWELVLVVLISPVCWMKKLDSQKISSIGSLSSAIIIVLVIVSFPLWGGNQNPTGICAFRLTTKFFNIFPTFVFAYTCHQNVFTVFNEFSPQNRNRKMKATIASTYSIAFIVYCLIGFSGYFTLGDKIDSNILNSCNTHTLSLPFALIKIYDFCFDVIHFFFNVLKIVINRSRWRCYHHQQACTHACCWVRVSHSVPPWAVLH